MFRQGHFLSLGPLLSIMAVEVGTAVARQPRHFTLPLPASIEGVGVKAGVYVVSWKAHSPEAVVRLAGNNTIVTAKGKLVQHNGRFERDAVVYSRRSDGSRAVIEIRLAGLDQALTFCEPAGTNLGAAEPARAAEKAPRGATSDGCRIASRVQFVGNPRITATPPARNNDPDSYWGPSFTLPHSPRRQVR